MATLISFINFLHAVFAALVGALLAPFASMSPLYGLLFVSGVCGVLLLFIYGKVSNQARIKRIKTAIHAEILECVIFRHDVRLCLGAQARLFKNGFLYFCFAVPPLLIMCLPCLLLLAQLNLRFESRRFAAGESGLLTVTMGASTDLYELKLSAPESLEIAGPVRIPVSHEVVWRFKLKEVARETLDVMLSLKGNNYPLELQVGQSSGIQQITQGIYGSALWRLMYPVSGLKSASGIAASPFESINISYPIASYKLLGFDLNWLVIFFVFSLLSGLVASRYFKVEI